MVDTTRSGFPAEMVRKAHPGETGPLEQWAEDLVDAAQSYAREKPVAAMLWALGIGFVLGWRLKPW